MNAYLQTLNTRINSLATTVGSALKLRGFRPGGLAGRIAVKLSNDDFDTGWQHADFLAVKAAGSTSEISLSSRFREVISPRDFGAVGNGSTNDISAIRAALAAMGSGQRTLDLKGRRYAINAPIFLGSIEGMQIINGTLVALPSDNWTDANAMIVCQAARQVVDSVVLECATVANGVRLAAVRGSVRQCDIKDINKHGVYIGERNCNVSNCMIRQLDRNDPARLSPSSRTARGITVKATESLVCDNDISLCQYCVYLEDTADLNLFSGNHFWDSAASDVLTKLVYVSEGARFNRFQGTHSENGLWEIRCFPSRITVHGLHYTMDATKTSAPTVFRFHTSEPDTTIAGASFQGLSGAATTPAAIFGLVTSGSGSWDGTPDLIRSSGVSTVINQQVQRVINASGNTNIQTLVAPYTTRSYQYFEGMDTTETVGHGVNGDEYQIITKGEQRVVVMGGNTSTEVKIKNIFESGDVKLDFYNSLNAFAGGFAVGSSTGNATYYIGNQPIIEFNQNDAVFPGEDNAIRLGSADRRWEEVFSATGTINTSDSREKQQIRSLSEAELAVATALKGLVKAFKFNSAVTKKGDDARIHIGVIAQEVKSAFESQGLVAEDYGILCHDELEDGGDRYGVRYEELLAFIIASL